MKIQLAIYAVAAATALPFTNALPTILNKPLANLFDTGLFGRRNLKRDLTAVPDTLGDQCPVNNSTLLGEELLHFTGIFFHDFITGGGNDILGPLAVGGEFNAPNYIVNANKNPDCSVDINTSIASYALVVQGLTNTVDTDVHGSSFHAGGGTIDEINEEDPPCEVYSDRGTGRFDFNVAEEGANDISELLAVLTPNHILQNSGEMISLGGDSQIRVLTFNTCNNRDCPTDGALSDPTGIFFNDGNFNGPTGDVPSETDTIVFNIPVINGDTITLTGNQPSLGFNSCRTIYNFYPVTENGQFMRHGEFTLIRQTGSQLEGFSLAPRGHIRDGTTGNFAGTIVGYDYTWDQFPIGVEIHDYAAANCDAFVGCLPINPGQPNMTVTSTAYKTKTTASMTITETSTRTHATTFTDFDTVTEEHTVTTVSTEPGETVYETIYINDPSKKDSWDRKGKKKDSWDHEGKKGGSWDHEGKKDGSWDHEGKKDGSWDHEGKKDGSWGGKGGDKKGEKGEW